MVVIKKTPFDEAVSYLTGLSQHFYGLSGTVKNRVQEIRLRSGQFITLELGTDRLRLNVKVNPVQLEELIKSFCNYSVHSFSKQLSEGYITLAGGHRAGFAGTAVISNNQVSAVRDITSINLRIAKEYKGCSDFLYNKLFYGSENIKGLLIIGRPMSAKTTVLRDMVRNISENNKVSVIDERGELAAKNMGCIGNDLGPNTDVLDLFPKSEGFITALRALSPDYIVCDEIGQDGENLLRCTNSGVRFIVTVHASGIEEIFLSPVIGSLLETNGISHVALLGTGKEIGELKSLWRLELERNMKNEQDNTVSYMLGNGRVYRAVPIR